MSPLIEAGMPMNVDHLEQLYESILQSAGEGIYGLDAEGRANFVNPAAQDILGWTESDLIGEYIHDYHHHSHADGNHYPREDCPIYAALEDGRVHREADEVFWHKDGRPIAVEYVSTPIFENGKIAGAVIIFADVSARKEAERQREDALAEIERLNRALESERDYLREEVSESQHFGDIIGDSAVVHHMMAKIDAVSKTDASVLIHGESGVGKELVAREIHHRSRRKEQALIKVNCAAIQSELFESEFFGHVRGAFTGAHAERIGRFELADGGTLFLDEVGDLPLEQQGKLLRALQEQEFERVGGTRTQKVDVRVIAATNHDLDADIEAGRFRQDLYFRLNVFPIEVPPLRDRGDDVVSLACHFLEQNALSLQRPALRLGESDAEILKHYDWPGNVRELQHVIARAAILSTGESVELDPHLQSGIVSIGQPGAVTAKGVLTETQLRDLERNNIEAALRATGWRISGASGAAKVLGIKATTLEYRIRKYGIQKERAS